jgi:hypothetical protein
MANDVETHTVVKVLRYSPGVVVVSQHQYEARGLDLYMTSGFAAAVVVVVWCARARGGALCASPVVVVHARGCGARMWLVLW